MSETLFSSSWYRVAPHTPRIRSHVQFHRHRYRGAPWYVLQDRSGGRCHRLSASAYRLAGLMDGRRTIQQIWDDVCTRLGDDAPTQDETIRILGLLHQSDALQCDITPDTAELLRRSQRRETGERWQRYANPMAVRIPLLDPDAFLERWLPVVRPLFSTPAALAYCLLAVVALYLTGAHWAEISQGAAASLLDPRNLLVMFLVYPVVKGLHELGHAFATKIWGGEVHEMGILLLVFVPLPYVDASASSAFPDKWKRVAVGAAGILVELGLAALALIVWLLAEPGLVRTIAYNVMWIGGASTLLFNGNPLLRFDGYYVLADAIEIPNLSARANQYLGWWVLKRVFKLDNARDPVTAAGEPAWFVGYGVAAFCYRLFVMFAIALFVSSRFFVFGVLFACLAVTMQVVVPVLKHTAFLLRSPRLAERRARALAISGGAAALLAGFLLGVPVPLFTMAEGVVWPPEGAQVVAGADGFVVRLLAEPNQTVAPGDPLVLTRNPSLEAETAVLEARLRELRAVHHGQRGEHRVQAQMTRDEMATVEASLARARERAGEVVLRSPAHGSFVLLRPGDLEGGYLKQGQLIGYVVGPSVSTARVVVPQADAALVRERTRAVEVRLASRIGEALPATILRQVPAASDRLPSRALGTTGGGRLAVDPSDPDGLRTLETVFQLDLSLPPGAAGREIGERAYVRFDHGAEPLGLRAVRALRRLFLRQIGA